MYDVRLFRPPNKETATAVIVAVVLLVVVFCAGYLLGLRNVSDHGSGTEPITNELGQVGSAIGNAKDGIEQATSTAGAVAGTVADAQGTAEYISGTVNDSAELIADCQRIIRQVRARGKK